MFYKWKEQFLEGGRKGLAGKDPDRALIKENEELKGIIGEMTIANEILKKNYITILCGCFPFYVFMPYLHYLKVIIEFPGDILWPIACP